MTFFRHVNKQKFKMLRSYWSIFACWPDQKGDFLAKHFFFWIGLHKDFEPMVSGAWIPFPYCVTLCHSYDVLG